MENTITGFYINDLGDMSAGIFPQEWKLFGEFNFSSVTEFEEFKEALADSFELVTGGRVIIESFQGRNERLRKELSKGWESLRGSGLDQPIKVNL